MSIKTKQSMKLKITDSEETYLAEVNLHSCLQWGNWEIDNPSFLISNWDRSYAKGAKIILKNVYGRGFDLIEIDKPTNFPKPLFLAKVTKID